MKEAKLKTSKSTNIDLADCIEERGEKSWSLAWTAGGGGRWRCWSKTRMSVEMFVIKK